MIRQIKWIPTILFLFFSASLAAQSLLGLTGKPDTGYTNSSALKSTLKSHPQISLVPEIHSPKVRETKGIVYCNPAGRDLVMDAFEPVSTKKRAAILIIHGGGWRSGNRTQHYPLAQHLALLGYSCFTAEYRLSTEALYPAAVYDLKAAVRWLYANSKKYHLDTSKIAVLGFSAGGELAAFLGTTNGKKEFEGNACDPGSSGLVKAVIDIDGTLSFVHPESGEGDDSKSTSAATYWFGYPKKDNYALWEQASPLTYAGRNTPPTLFLNSSVDRMHAGREDYISILEKFGTYSETHAFKDAPHSFCLFNPWFNPTVKYIDGFLKKVLQKSQ